MLLRVARCSAICEGAVLPTGSPRPWAWTAWWANALRIGDEMGREFSRGLLHAAHVAKDLDIGGGKLNGDRLTAVQAASQLMRELHVFSADRCSLRADAAEVMAKTILVRGSKLTRLSLQVNELQDAGIQALAGALPQISTLQELRCAVLR